MPPLRGGGGLFLVLDSRLAGAGAYFSLAGKVAKVPSRDVPSLENPSHVFIYLRYDLIDWLSCGVLWAASRRSVGGCALLGDFDWPFGALRGGGVCFLH